MGPPGSLAANGPVLSVRDLTMRFGGVRAVTNVSFGVRKQQIFSIIGPNGAGKTTVFNCVSGIYKPLSGRVFLHETEITGLPPERIAAVGIARTFQNIRVFPSLSALENLLVAGDLRYAYSLAAFLGRPGYVRDRERRLLEHARETLRSVGLQDYADDLAKNLPYGTLKRVELARALMTCPQVLLLDEPAAGLNPNESAVLMQLIDGIRNTGITILLIEHDMRVVMSISDRILVLDEGSPIAEGSPKEVTENPAVISAYLGKPPESPAPGASSP
jgi:branched-chain amino acid transport system ATP-binding protein